MDKVKTLPDNNMRPRFLRRARLEGIAFSPDVEESTRHVGKRVGLFAASATALATVIVMLVVYGIYRRPVAQSSQAQQQIEQLKQENATLAANLSRSSERVTRSESARESRIYTRN